MEKAAFQEVAHGSDLYWQTERLRYKVLREPLGLHFTQKQLAAEKDDHHLALLIEAIVVACLVLSPQNADAIQMRQVVVDESRQQKGFGRMLVKQAEQFARQKGYVIMYCHARDIAIPFYLNIGYHIIGDPFTEIGIKHYYMEKTLTD